MATVKVSQSTMLRMALRELGEEARKIESVDIEYETRTWTDGTTVYREHTGTRSITIITVGK